MNSRIRSCIAIGVVVAFLFGTFIQIIASDAQEDAPEITQPVKAEIQTAPTISLSIVKGTYATYPTYLHTKVNFSLFPYPLYFRFTTRSNTNTLTLATAINSSCTQVVNGNHWYINSSDGDYKLNVNFFYGGVDACGDHLLNMWANTTNNNQTKFNTSNMQQYIGVGAGCDENWVSKVKAATYYDYYYLNYPNSGLKYVRYAHDVWLSGVANQCYLPGLYWQGITSTKDTNWAWTDDNRVQDHFLRCVFKFQHSRSVPITDKMTVFMEVESGGGEAQLLSYDDPDIYPAIKAQGIDRVQIQSGWMTEGTYDAITPAGDSAIRNISTYCHDNDLEFGLYYGWMAFAEEYFVANFTRDSTNVERITDTWTNFSTKWGDIVDYYYFDFSSVGINYVYSPMANWSYYNMVYLDPIFKEIISTTDKNIFYNAVREAWWVGDRFTPVKFEGASIVTLKTGFAPEILGDPVVHSLNYTSQMAYHPFFWRTGIIFDTYDVVAARETAHLCYLWGIALLMTYGLHNTTGIPSCIAFFEGWKGGCNRTGSVSGTSGLSGSFESDPSYWVKDASFSNITHYSFTMLENQPWFYTLEITLTNSSMATYGVSVYAMNATTTGDWVSVNLITGGLTKGEAYRPIWGGVIVDDSVEVGANGYLNYTVTCGAGSLYVFLFEDAVSTNDLFGLMIAVVVFGALMTMIMAVIKRN